ncbi:glycoside hydrolase family 15 protein [Paraburkholderia lycopersici]|uniref:Glucoamylase (Glucan-1,4-alpha-glucosidase), GH15 family n=1 Tax=Paraburkholderia lycopersici TaxID=416944 RepID=A0A1G7D0B7_9BURK|nr:glycoside hydrolase family 15 protein [Paraburkholderia lycopersici]SDE45042.1 Glucoamylase (glucan-1,4-alpha-glucosidase), GH15 family [Paraburkholderia lycopersici]
MTTTRSIEDYALLADGRSAALLSRDGSIDWLCWPRFDSAPCFAALLGGERDGCWHLAPVDAPRRVNRSYQPDTLVVETEHECEPGSVRVTDFMAAATGEPCLVRIVEGLHGSVAVRTALQLRGAVAAKTTVGNNGVATVCSSCGAVTLRTDVPLEARAHSLQAIFTVRAGQRVAFTLCPDECAGLDTSTAVPALHDTQRHWRRWINDFDDSRTLWPQAVRRSLLTLKALIDRSSGAMVAAPTTSLPETPGGDLNWDYRYCWVRDASFALEALLEAGFHDEARAWRDWLLRTLGTSHGRIHVAYCVDGSRVPRERCVESLAGWQGARPVRFGNAAATQYQPDVFGEGLDCLYLARRAGIDPTADEVDLEARIVGWLLEHSDKPGSGIWETRGAARQYTVSRVMAWVALDRFIKHWCKDGPGAGDPFVQRAIEQRDKFHEEVGTHAWDAQQGAFVRCYGETGLDASVLLMPLVGFMRADEPRMSATIDVIRRELGDGGLIGRWRRGDDLAPNEGTFLACSCWMADCLYLRGDEDAAREQFERVLAVANDVGLLAEEYDVRTGTLAGNFPQALSHLAVVKTALLLSGSAKGHRRGS